MSRKPTAVGGDVFAGLFSIGVRRSGFDVVAHLEHCDYGAATCRTNWPELDVRIGRERWSDGPSLKGRVDFMFTNPPCAPWSGMSSATARWKANEHIGWVKDLADEGRRLGVDFWCWESVIGAWTKGRVFVTAHAQRWIDAGYNVTILLQNNMFLGAPQDRKRMIFFAHRRPLVWPKFKTPRDVSTILGPVRSLPEEIAEAAAATSPWYKTLWRAAERENGSLRRAYYALPDAKRKGAKPSFMDVRIRADDVPPVITQHRLHPTQPRILTLRETRALCGVPDTFKRPAGIGLRAAQIEMQKAVLPPVGEWLGRAVMSGLGMPRIKRPECVVVDMRDPENVTTERIDLGARLPDAVILPVPSDAPPKPARVPSTRAPRQRSLFPRETSKAFVRAALARDKYNLSRRPPNDWCDDMARRVRDKFPGRTTKRSDIIFIWARQEKP